MHSDKMLQATGAASSAKNNLMPIDKKRLSPRKQETSPSI